MIIGFVGGEIEATVTRGECEVKMVFGSGVNSQKGLSSPGANNGGDDRAGEGGNQESQGIELIPWLSSAAFSAGGIVPRCRYLLIICNCEKKKDLFQNY